MASQSFGKYLVSEVLGSGGMAEVYAGVHPDLERKVAIKVILPQFATESNFEERFRREARVVASLRHAHIVQIYDFDVVDGRYFMVMEYLEGGTLKDHLRGLQRQNARMTPAEIARFVEAIGGALDYAHGRGAIHRDIKPANILFTKEREPVLTDFGIAKLLEDAVRLTATGGVLGSPFYMPPEQATGSEVDARGDQYSLGVMLYEMATGRLPFLGSSAVAVMTQHCNSAPPPPRSLNAELPVAVEAVLLKALAKRANDRFGTAGELAAAFRQAAGDSRVVNQAALPVKEQTQSALDDATLLGEEGNDATLPSAVTLPETLPETATLPSARTAADATAVVDAGPRAQAPIDDAATLVTQSAQSVTPPPAQPASVPAPLAQRPQADPPPAEVASDNVPLQPPALRTPAHLQATDKSNAADDIKLPPAQPAPLPKPTTQNFNVSGIQAGIVNQGGEQTFSGDLSFNLNFGDVKAAPPAQQPAAKAAAPGVGDDAELGALLEALRRAFAGSARVDRFVRLVTQFQTQLEALPEDRANDRKQVVKRVQALLLEMTEAKPDPDLVEIMGTSLQRAVQPLALVDPDLPTLVTRITSWVELIVQPE